MAENTEPLLKRKVYFDGCPGCKQDRRKEASSGIPYKEFFYVWIITLCTALPISSLFPFIYFMIRDLHVAKREEDIGFYAGFVGASFMFGRALTSLFWGVVADRYGRKPVILLGIFSVSVTTAWSIGLIVGPALGGFFAQPAEKYPEIFSQDSFFGRFPYFLPCLCISLFAVCVLIGSLWLPETLHKHDSKKMGETTIEDVETPYSSDSKGHTDKDEESDTQPKANLFRNWPLMSSVVVYCIFSLHDMAYTEIFSLWAVSDKSYGGLSFSSQDVGEVLSISGFGLLVFQILLYPRIEKLLGPVSSLRVASVLTIPLLAAYPFMSKLSGLQLTLIVNCASLLKNVLSVMIVIGLFILQNNAVSQEQRGAANGIAMTAMSFFKAIAPAAGGAIFSWAQKRQHASFFPGDQMVFFILNMVELMGLLFSFKPFLIQPSK
ncbi:major facilitator superfamily antiporter [Musa troglodytarum]|uniref:Major facilitator superfamily antiporter n=1 Tax=Musa troglodytarum TaxID=320322 RepID=A0A9E7GPU5_9LILI|nr:major facilitator superfamily antiporter [Musa troglodytarum]